MKPLDPDGDVKIVWDIFVMCLLVYCAFEIPFSAAFYGTGTEYDPMSQTITVWSLWGVVQVEVLDLVVSIVFLFDISICFITSYVENGRSETDLKKISKRYFQGWFTLDVIALVPADKIAELFTSQSDVIPAFRIFRIVRLIKLIGRRNFETQVMPLVRRILHVEAVPTGLILFMRIAKPLFVMFFMAHLLGCTFIVLADGNPNSSWLAKYQGDLDYIHGASTTRYVIALYWAIITVTTVGYGDIVPVTDYERAFVIVAALVGVVVFSSFMSSLSSGSHLALPGDLRLREQQESAARLIQRREMSADTRRRVHHFFDSLWRDRQRRAEEAALLAEVDPATRRLLLLEIGEHIRREAAAGRTGGGLCPEAAVAVVRALLQPHWQPPGFVATGEENGGRSAAVKVGDGDGQAGGGDGDSSMSREHDGGGGGHSDAERSAEAARLAGLLSTRLTAVGFYEGEEVYPSGAAAKELYLVSTGAVRLEARPCGLPSVTVLAGDLFGEDCLVTGPAGSARRRERAVAATATVVILTLPLEDLAAATAEFPAAAARLIGLVRGSTMRRAVKKPQEDAGHGAGKSGRRDSATASPQGIGVTRTTASVDSTRSQPPAAGASAVESGAPLDVEVHGSGAAEADAAHLGIPKHQTRLYPAAPVASTADNAFSSAALPTEPAMQGFGLSTAESSGPGREAGGSLGEELHQRSAPQALTTLGSRDFPGWQQWSAGGGGGGGGVGGELAALAAEAGRLLGAPGHSGRSGSMRSPTAYAPLLESEQPPSAAKFGGPAPSN